MPSPNTTSATISPNIITITSPNPPTTTLPELETVVVDLNDAKISSPASVLEIDDFNTTSTNFDTPDALKTHLSSTPTKDRIYILRGLPLDFIQLLGSHFDLDPEFVNSHALRRPYWRRCWDELKAGLQCVATFKYPELVESEGEGCCGILGCQSDADVGVQRLKDGKVVMKDPAHLLLREKRFSDEQRYLWASLSQVSFWSRVVAAPGGERTFRESLLLIEKAEWEDQGVWKASDRQQPLQHAMTALNSASTAGVWQLPEASLSPMSASYEDIMVSALQTGKYYSPESITALLSNVVLAKWGSFVDVFESCMRRHLDMIAENGPIPSLVESQPNVHDKALEFLRDSIVTYTHRDEENQRLTRSISSNNRLSDIKDALLQCRTTILDAATNRETNHSSERHISIQTTTSPDPKASSSSSSDDDDHDPRKHALDRLSFLGGILLPSTIIAGILSMSGDFAAGSRLFWVYWAITIPLVLLTMATVYVDTIRMMSGYQYCGEKPPPAQMPAADYSRHYAMVEPIAAEAATPYSPEMAKRLGWVNGYKTLVGWRPK